MSPVSRPPNWLRLARKDFLDSYRDRTLHYVGALYVAIGAVLGRQYNLYADPGTPLSESAVVALLVVLVPVTALSGAYDVLPSDRRSGRLRLLLTLPFSRRDVVAGTALGRAAVVGALTAALLGSTGAVALVYGTVPPLVDLAVLTLASVLYGAATAGVVVAAGTPTAIGPLVLAGGGAGLFASLFWNDVVAAAWDALVGPVPAWYGALRGVDLLAAYPDAAAVAHGGDPSGVLLLVAWAVVATALGVGAFRRVAL